MAITLRDTNAEDQNFLLEVYATTRAAEMALVPWTDEQREAFVRMQFSAQDSYYRTAFPRASYQIILDDGKPVGRVYVLREAEAIEILDITVLQQHRNRGIGTGLLRELLDEGALAGKSVRIWVEHFNPSRGWLERLGFSRIREEGFNWLLECRSANDNA